MFRRIFLPSFAALLLAVSATAQPQDAFPNRALRIIVPFTPGGGADLVARAIAQKMTENWIQSRGSSLDK